ncbi:IS256 family transposase [Saccharopolyspora cebuensis]|uniref:IS256 family transposase n=1 Tax=Saccharopolyspora cebuensis TaxID=418759 RepID=UPI003F7782F0
MAGALTPEALDSLAQGAQAGGGSAGVQELLNEMTKAVLERALDAEMTHHLGYEKGDPSGTGTGNSRNGRSVKTVSTSQGPVTIEVPRDRASSFEPVIVPKLSRRLGQINEAILSLYSRGMTTRDIEAHLKEVYGVEASRELISNVTEVVTDEIALWQSRPLDEVYPTLYVDGIRLRIKDKGMVTPKTAYLVIGVDLEGRKHTLGCWIAETGAAKFWHKVITDLRNRGIKNILIASCDGLTGLPDAIRSVFPGTVAQTRVVHVVRNAMRFVSFGGPCHVFRVSHGKRDRARGLAGVAGPAPRSTSLATGTGALCRWCSRAATSTTARVSPRSWPVPVRWPGSGRPCCRPDRVIADKGYSSRAIRTGLRQRRIRTTIPERRDQQHHRLRKGSADGRPPAFDRAAYRRNVVERCFQQLKQFRAIATRYDKTAQSYQAMIDLATLTLSL